MKRVARFFSVAALIAAAFLSLAAHSLFEQGAEKKPTVVDMGLYKVTAPPGGGQGDASRRPSRHWPYRRWPTMRAVLEVPRRFGCRAKSKGSSNPYNMVRATFDALKTQSSPRQVANRRGLKVADLVSRRKDGASLGEVAAEG